MTKEEVERIDHLFESIFNELKSINTRLTAMETSMKYPDIKLCARTEEITSMKEEIRQVQRDVSMLKNFKLVIETTTKVISVLFSAQFITNVGLVIYFLYTFGKHMWEK